VAHDLPAELVELMPRLRRFGVALTRSFVDADDLVQAACERALSRGVQLRGETNMGAWMYTMMRNLWIDELRSRRTRRYDGIEAAHGVMGDDGEALAERNNTWAAVRRALSQLPAQQRAALTLICVDGMTYKETAEILEIPVGTLASRVARGRQTLYEQLAGVSSIAGCGAHALAPGGED
jgi:RNA polymerase sigma-70 factor (ECF subfamily)